MTMFTVNATTAKTNKQRAKTKYVSAVLTLQVLVQASQERPVGVGVSKIASSVPKKRYKHRLASAKKESCVIISRLFKLNCLNSIVCGRLRKFSVNH